MMRLWPIMNQAGKACKVKSHHVKGTQMCFKKLNYLENNKSGKHILMNQLVFWSQLKVKVKGSQ